MLVQQARRSDALALSVKMRALLSANEQWYGLATLDAILGNTDAAIEALRKAAYSGSFDRARARADPDLAAIRGHPSFGAIIDGLE